MGGGSTPPECHPERNSKNYRVKHGGQIEVKGKKLQTNPLPEVPWAAGPSRQTTKGDRLSHLQPLPCGILPPMLPKHFGPFRTNRFTSFNLALSRRNGGRIAYVTPCRCLRELSPPPPQFHRSTAYTPTTSIRSGSSCSIYSK